MNSQQTEKYRSQRTVDKPYATWTHSERMALIQSRIKHDVLFSSKNSNMSTGWREVVADCKSKLGPDKTYVKCKKQWTGLLTKYKGFFILNTGDGAGDEAPEDKCNKEEWPYYDMLHRYASRKDNYHPPYLLSNSNGIFSNDREIIEEPDTEVILEVIPVPLTSLNSISTPSTSSDSCNLSASSSSSPSVLRSSSSRAQNKLNMADKERKAREKAEKKLNKRINSLMSVFGQIVRTDYPNVNVDSLLISSGSDDSD